MFPHTLSARPLVINSSSTIRLRFSHRRNDLEISCDSQIALPIQEGEDVLIRRCDYHLNLIHPKDYSYFNIKHQARLVKKIILILRQPLYCI